MIAASLNGVDLSSDAGVLLLRRTYERIRLTRAIARVITDGRRAASVTPHSITRPAPPCPLLRLG